MCDVRGVVCVVWCAVVCVLCCGCVLCVVCCVVCVVWCVLCVLCVWVCVCVCVCCVRQGYAVQGCAVRQLTVSGYEFVAQYVIR